MIHFSSFHFFVVTGILESSSPQCETTLSDYEIIRQSVEDAIPNCTVHIYGSCLYMTNPDNKPTDLNLYIEFGKFAHWFVGIYLENGD